MPARTSPGYLVEWYQPDLADGSVPLIVAALEAAAAAASEPVELFVTMGVPSDEVVYALFEASSSDAVIDVCERAGYPPQRVTADVDAHFRTEPLAERADGFLPAAQA